PHQEALPSQGVEICKGEDRGRVIPLVHIIASPRSQGLLIIARSRRGTVDSGRRNTGFARRTIASLRSGWRRISGLPQASRLSRPSVLDRWPTCAPPAEPARNLPCIRCVAESR